MFTKLKPVAKCIKNKIMGQCLKICFARQINTLQSIQSYIITYRSRPILSHDHNRVYGPWFDSPQPHVRHRYTSTNRLSKMYHWVSIRFHLGDWPYDATSILESTLIVRLISLWLLGGTVSKSPSMSFLAVEV